MEKLKILILDLEHLRDYYPGLLSPSDRANVEALIQVLKEHLKKKGG